MPTQCGCKLEKHSENYKVEEMIFWLNQDGLLHLPMF